MTRAFISLGSNLGDKKKNIVRAVEELGRTPGLRVGRMSRLRETDPVGRADQPKFLNAVVEIESDLAAEALLARMLDIEARRFLVEPPKDYKAREIPIEQIRALRQDVSYPPYEGRAKVYIIADAERLYVSDGGDEEWLETFRASYDPLRSRWSGPSTLVDARSIIREMRLIKDEEDIRTGRLDEPSLSVRRRQELRLPPRGQDLPGMPVERDDD